MWEVVSASPSTGLSSGRRSSLGPLSEREQKMLRSHGRYLLQPVLPKSGQQVRNGRLVGSDSSPAERSPDGMRDPDSAEVPFTSMQREQVQTPGVPSHLVCAPWGPALSLPVLPTTSFYVLFQALRTNTWERDKGLSSWCDADITQC